MRGLVLSGGLFIPVLLIVLALLIIAVTVTAAVWDDRKIRPRAERGIVELSTRVRVLPAFAVAEFSAELDDARVLLERKRYRDCIKRTERAGEDFEKLMEVVRQGRAELLSIEKKVEESRALGLVIDRGAIGLDGVERFWGVKE